MHKIIVISLIISIMFGLPIMYALGELTANELHDTIDRKGEQRQYCGIKNNEERSLYIIDMIGQVSESSIESHITKLQDFGTRYIYSEQCNLSAEYIYNEFNKTGTLDVDYDFFEYNNSILRNVVATLYGQNASNPISIICAHYDSISNLSKNNPDALAPGADDDASGVAVMLEAAKILSNYTFNSTIKFIAFSGEELGLFGSKHFVNNLQKNSDLSCVFNVEMIGYSPSGLEDEPEIDVIGNLESEWIIDYMNLINLNYSIGLIINKVIAPGLRYSDHVPFWDADFTAVCAIEESNMSSESFNPYMHTSEDTIDKLNFTLIRKATQLIVAAVATLTNESFVDLNIPPLNTTLTNESYVDLSISSSNITFTNPNPTAGEEIIINAIISNNGRANATLVSVKFFIDDIPIDNKTVSHISARSYEIISVRWIAIVGTHTIKIKIDPENKINESDETNNEAYNTIIVEALPDREGIPPWILPFIAILVISVILFLLLLSSRGEALQDISTPTFNKNGPNYILLKSLY